MTTSLSDPSAVRTAVEKLFDDKPPVLVEVRFPNMGTSPDWFLCEEAAALNVILDRLGPGVEVHLHSVWDLQNPTGALVVCISPEKGDKGSIGRIGDIAE